MRPSKFQRLDNEAVRLAVGLPSDSGTNIGALGIHGLACKRSAGPWTNGTPSEKDAS